MPSPIVVATLREEIDGPSTIYPTPRLAIWGDSLSGAGVAGTSYRWYGVIGISGDYAGVLGLGGLYGVNGENINGYDGVHGDSDTGNGVSGSSEGSGVYGDSGDGDGITGHSQNGNSIQGVGEKNGTAGSFSNFVMGLELVHGKLRIVSLKNYMAGFFGGNVQILGNLFVSGQKGFKIDHPLNPSTKYLVHSAVESPEMKNLYDGIATLNAKGEAAVTLPEYFTSLNKEFRYQLTAIGESAPGLYVAEEIKNNKFKIGGGKNRMRVAWQVTGIRDDLWARKNPTKAEEAKPKDEKGRYLHPELYSKTPTVEEFLKICTPRTASQIRKMQKIKDSEAKNKANSERHRRNLRSIFPKGAREEQR
jgi:hypothetical protein